jgi:hypothetical protein
MMDRRLYSLDFFSSYNFDHEVKIAGLASDIVSANPTGVISNANE